MRKALWIHFNKNNNNFHFIVIGNEKREFFQNQKWLILIPNVCSILHCFPFIIDTARMMFIFWFFQHNVCLFLLSFLMFVDDALNHISIEWKSNEKANRDSKKNAFGIKSKVNEWNWGGKNGQKMNRNCYDFYLCIYFPSLTSPMDKWTTGQQNQKKKWNVWISQTILIFMVNFIRKKYVLCENM